ncbi:MAG: hypothetical protein F6K18_34160 [Okeania sp. SIO2C2]|uniref:hypothetical protein n=1 Tax=Okeania sp. SIO2C2 TaxID=2607787 RepID=UPI0013B6DB3C|nr:hypothetical protein [Okeania sp. SIO2C2]NEP91436.1 hypothetical protein [Okeania sp. SIO2C2]
MSLNIQGIVSSVKEELAPQFEEKLRSYLVQQDREWLIEQIIRLTLDSLYIKKKDIKAIQEQKAQDRLSRIERLKDMALDREKLDKFLKKHEKIDRNQLIEAGYLINNPPEKGTDLITEKYRSNQGNELLLLAKDVLFALLFGDESNHVKFS